VTLTITPATAADLDALVELLDDMDQFYGDTPEDPQHRRALIQRLILTDQPVAHVLLARLPGVGAVGLAAYSFLWPAAGATHSLYLKELHVRRDHRRSGIGRALMQRLAEIADNAGCSRIEWTTDTSNDNAQKFYTLLGATPHAGKLAYRIEGPDIRAACERWNER
jgi:ribosomal protein S18 acetylase RimI-like enzyme